METWPSSLPMPEQSGYAIKHVSPLVRTDMQSGRARQRRAFTSVPSQVSVQWFCTDHQAQIFESWFQSKITDGADWFDCALKTPSGGIGYYKARFVDIYDGPTLTNLNFWSFSATLEIYERQIIDSEWLDFQEFIIDQAILDIAINREWPSA